MTKHLSPEQFVDAIDDTLAPLQREHLGRCAECRRELETLRGVADDLRPAADVPGVSPLFWDHFPGRVQAATATETVPARGWWTVRWQPLAALTAVLAIAAVVITVRSVTPDLPRVERSIVDATPGPIPLPADPAAMAALGQAASGDPQVDEASPAAVRSWNRVVAAGRSASSESVHAVTPANPAAAVLIEELTPRELKEFARLLRAEMGGTQ